MTFLLQEYLQEKWMAKFSSRDATYAFFDLHHQATQQNIKKTSHIRNNENILVRVPQIDK